MSMQSACGLLSCAFVAKGSVLISDHAHNLVLSESRLSLYTKAILGRYLNRILITGASGKGSFSGRDDKTAQHAGLLWAKARACLHSL